MLIVFFSEDHAVYEITWNNVVKPDTPQMTIWRMGIAFCITETTNIHSKFVMLTAFLLQHLLHKAISGLPVLFQLIN
jgi:hypothetical protein